MKKYCLFLIMALLAISTAHADGSKKFMKLYKKGKTFYNKINYSEALPYFVQAEEEAKKAGLKDTNYCNLLSEMAESYMNLKDMAKAESYYTSALTATEQAIGKDNNSYLRTLTGSAKLAYRTQQLSKAQALYLSAIPIYEKLNQKKTIRYAEVLTGIGNTLMQKGEYTKAEPYFVEAAEVIKSIKGTENLEYVSTQNNLSVIYGMLTDYDKAEKTYADLLKSQEKIAGKLSAAISLSNRGTLYYNLNRYKAAETDYKQALELYEKSSGKESPYYATTLNNLGVLYKANGVFGKSKQAFTEALAIREKNPGKESAAYATSLHNMGCLYDEAGEYDRAVSYLNDAKAIREKIYGKNHPDYVSSLDELGLNTMYLEKYSAAKPLFIEAVNTNLSFIKQNFPGMSEKEKSGFVANHGKYFDHFFLYCAYVSGYRGVYNKLEVPLADEKDLNGEWYNIRLATKGIILNSVQKTRTRILSSGDGALIEKFSKWEKLKNEIAQANSLTISDRTQKGIDLDKLKEQADKQEKELSLKSEAFKNVYDPAPVGWKDVQAKLKKGEAAIELIRITLSNDTIYSALIVTPETTSPQSVIITNGKNLEKKYFKYYQNCIRFKIIDEVTYDVYWKPIADKLKTLGKFSRIYLSTDGIYNQINPATLYNTSAGKYLGEETELYLLSTTKELTSISPSGVLKKKALLIGDPDFRLDNNTGGPLTPETETTRAYKGTIFSDLPGTDKEIKSINSTLTAFGWKTQIFSRQDAKEDKIKQVSYPTLVHIATHGFFLSSNNKDFTAPMLSSGVAFAGVNAKPETKKSEDGVLTAYEAMNLQLDSTELVVLSACETGLGETKTGEGVYGIQRGLRVSGAKTLIMSLWKVDDAATQELMSTFYKEWIATGNKHLAFSKAQAAIKKKYIYPYYWGAFVMVGE